MSFFELPIRTENVKGQPVLRTPQGYLHSPRSPDTEAERFCADLPAGPVLFVGPGAGHALPFLRNRPDVLFFEPIPAVARIMEKHPDFVQIRERYTSTIESLIRLLKEKGGTIAIRFGPAYSRLFPGLPALLPSLLRGDGSARTRLHFERTWYRNALHHTTRPALTFLRNIALKGLPVFLGAGPQVLEDLRPLPPREDCCYIAADTALPFLLRRQIEPDLVLSIDGGRGTAFHLQALPQKKIPIPVLTWVGGHPLLPDFFSEVLYYRSSFSWDQLALAATALPELNWSGGNISGLFLALVNLARGRRVALAGTHFTATQESHVPDTGYALYNRLQTRRTEREKQPAYLKHSDELRNFLQHNMNITGTDLSVSSDGPAGIRWETEEISSQIYRDSLLKIPDGPPLFQLEKYYQVADIRKNKNPGRN
ncbi:MAG: hypothetical protein HS115_03800 [Spirochaetales bacterium]|nr:hypothetical protein [Spirochaetales bacterium]